MILSMILTLVFVLPVFAEDLPTNASQTSTPQLQSASLKAPKVSAKAISSSQIKVGWNKVTGADCYYVFYCYQPNGAYILFVNPNDGTNNFQWAGTYSLTIGNIPSNTTMYFKVVAVKDGYESPYSKAAKATTLKPGKAEQVAALRAQEIVPAQGSILTINARIHNLIIELQIHKLRYESSSTFKGIVKGMIIQETSGSTLTLKAKQFNSIATQVIKGSMSDDTAISQLQALSLVQ